VIDIEACKPVSHFYPILEGDDLHVMPFIPILHCFTQLVDFILWLPNVCWQSGKVAIGKSPELINWNLEGLQLEWVMGTSLVLNFYCLSRFFLRSSIVTWSSRFFWSSLDKASVLSLKRVCWLFIPWWFSLSFFLLDCRWFRIFCIESGSRVFLSQSWTWLCIM